MITLNEGKTTHIYYFKPETSIFNVYGLVFLICHSTFSLLSVLFFLYTIQYTNNINEKETQ